MRNSTTGSLKRRAGARAFALLSDITSGGKNLPCGPGNAAAWVQNFIKKPEDQSYVFNMYFRRS